MATPLLHQGKRDTVASHQLRCFRRPCAIHRLFSFRLPPAFRPSSACVPACLGPPAVNRPSFALPCHAACCFCCKFRHYCCCCLVFLVMFRYRRLLYCLSLPSFRPHLFLYLHVSGLCASHAHTQIPPPLSLALALALFHLARACTPSLP